jgi:hypothetical protein
LDKLAEYQEAVEREDGARNISVDPNQIWGRHVTQKKTVQAPMEEGKSAKSQESDGKPDIDKLKRTDEWRRLFSPKGTFLASTVNTEHWLGFGLPKRLPVMLWGNNAFMSKHPAATVVRLADRNQLRLSGLLWPEAGERMARSAYATVESVGRGQIILFAVDPTFRMWLSGTHRLFLNATMLGPGLGASQPLPW